MFMMIGTFAVVSGRNTSAYRIPPSRIGILTSFSTMSLWSLGWETFSAFSATVMASPGECCVDGSGTRMASLGHPDVVVADHARPLLLLGIDEGVEVLGR